jgi:hypothetical protein
MPKSLDSSDRNGATLGINVAKGWVIVLVVLGHVLEGHILHGDVTAISGAAYAWIYSFHMPFYFLLSGWLFKGPQPPGRYLLSKSRHLLVPYMAWILLFNAVAIAGLCANIARGSLTPEKQVFYADLFQKQAYGGMYVHGYEVVLWFPTCLFLTQQLANAWYASLHRYMVWVLATVLYVVGYLNQYAASDFHLPWGGERCSWSPALFCPWSRSQKKRMGSRIQARAAVADGPCGDCRGADSPAISHESGGVRHSGGFDGRSGKRLHVVLMACVQELAAVRAECI